MEHFQMAPVAAAKSSLLPDLLSSESSGCRPLCFSTSSRVFSSSAHYKTLILSRLKSQNACYDFESAKFSPLINQHCIWISVMWQISTLKIALAQYIWSSSLFLRRFFTRSSIIPSVWIAILQLFCRDTTFTAVRSLYSREMTYSMKGHLPCSATVNRFYTSTHHWGKLLQVPHYRNKHVLIGRLEQACQQRDACGLTDGHLDLGTLATAPQSQCCTASDLHTLFLVCT